MTTASGGMNVHPLYVVMFEAVAGFWKPVMDDMTERAHVPAAYLDEAEAERRRADLAVAWPQSRYRVDSYEAQP